MGTWWNTGKRGLALGRGLWAHGANTPEEIRAPVSCRTAGRPGTRPYPQNLSLIAFVKGLVHRVGRVRRAVHPGTNHPHPHLLSPSRALVQVRQMETLRRGDPENTGSQKGWRWTRTPKQKDSPIADTGSPFQQ